MTYPQAPKGYYFDKSKQKYKVKIHGKSYGNYPSEATAKAKAAEIYASLGRGGSTKETYNFEPDDTPDIPVSKVKTVEPPKRAPTGFISGEALPGASLYESLIRQIVREELKRVVNQL